MSVFFFLISVVSTARKSHEYRNKCSKMEPLNFLISLDSFNRFVGIACTMGFYFAESFSCVSKETVEKC